LLLTNAKIYDDYNTTNSNYYDNDNSKDDYDNKKSNDIGRTIYAALCNCRTAEVEEKGAREYKKEVQMWASPFNDI